VAPVTGGSAAPGLERAARLLRSEVEPRGRPDAGYLDLLGPDEAPPSSGPVQDLMLSRPLARIYERWWRPALGRAAKGVLGPDMAGERRIAQELLELRQGDDVLDVACGTGAFTRDFGRSVDHDGLSLGIDVSETMLARAAAETASARLPQVAFVRGDAEDLPFRDDSFDGVCCFAALNLFSNPQRALDRIAAVLRPGGRVAIFTSVRGRSTALRAWEAVVARQTGMRMFERTEVTGALEDRGFTNVRQRLTGVTQFVGGQLAAR
jgi:ubiquinone/menaquinone biosynthesis C-methylase UbiE